MDWNSTVMEMKIKVTKDEDFSMKLVYDGKPLDDYAPWYWTCILGKEDVIMHLCNKR